MKQWVGRWIGLGIVWLGLLLLPTASHAVSYSVTAGTYGSSCGSGGYFTPSTINVTAGQSITITFSVPSNDPYAGGMEIRGFPGGTFQVALGGSANTTFTAGSSFSFSGYWPSSGCHKGDGTVVVTAAATPPPTPAATPIPVVATPTPVQNRTPTPKATPTPAASAVPSPTATAPPQVAVPVVTGGASPTPLASASPNATPAFVQHAGLIAGGGLALLLLLGGLGLLMYRRLTRPVAPESTAPNPASDTANTGQDNTEHK